MHPPLEVLLDLGQKAGIEIPMICPQCGLENPGKAKFCERLLRDGMLVLFGVPKAHEDDAARALRAALEIHEFV